MGLKKRRIGTRRMGRADVWGKVGSDACCGGDLGTVVLPGSGAGCVPDDHSAPASHQTVPDHTILLPADLGALVLDGRRGPGIRRPGNRSSASMDHFLSLASAGALGGHPGAGIRADVLWGGLAVLRPVGGDEPPAGVAEPTQGQTSTSSGTTLFTLGLGDVTPHTHLARVVLVIECGTGAGVCGVGNRVCAGALSGVLSNVR